MEMNEPVAGWYSRAPRSVRPVAGSSAPLLPGNPRLPGDVRLYPRVCHHDRYVPHDRIKVAEKTSLQMHRLNVYDVTRTLPRLRAIQGRPLSAMRACIRLNA